jgi:hypothetical protein
MECNLHGALEGPFGSPNDIVWQSKIDLIKCDIGGQNAMYVYASKSTQDFSFLFGTTLK